MSSARAARLTASGAVLLCFTGTWLAHTVEYARVWGVDGLRSATLGAAHLYMLPLAALLAALAGVGALRLRAARRGLDRRLALARRGLHSLWRGRQPELPRQSSRRPSELAGLASLWLPLAAAQLGLYMVQENIEALAAGLPPPGFGPVTGVHWAAPIVHLAVALVLAALVRVMQRRFVRVATTVAQVEALVRQIARGFAALHLRPLALTGAQPAAPLERVGSHLWRRPPPQPISA